AAVSPRSMSERNMSTDPTTNAIRAAGKRKTIRLGAPSMTPPPPAPARKRIIAIAFVSSEHIPIELDRDAPRIYTVSQVLFDRPASTFAGHALERDGFRLNRHRALDLWVEHDLSENRHPLFRIIFYPPG